MDGTSSTLQAPTGFSVQKALLASKGNSSNARSNSSYVSELLRQSSATPQVELVRKKKAKRKKTCALM